MGTTWQKWSNVAMTVLMVVALLIVGRTAVHAQPAAATLPTLRLEYFTGYSSNLADVLDPADIDSGQVYDAVMLVYRGLVYVGTDDKVHLGLAQKVAISKDRMTYTFTIRSNARFSNGDPVTAADVKYAIERSLAHSTASPVAMTYLGIIAGAAAYNAGKATSVSGVKVLSSRVVQIHIVKPYAYFLMTMTYPTSFPLDPKILAGKTAAVTGNYLTLNCPANVGTGPFTFQCDGDRFYPAGRTPSYTFVPNRSFYGAKPHVKIVTPAIASTDVSYREYVSGGIDVTTVPTGVLGQWRHSPQFHQNATSLIFWLEPNLHMAPLSDVHCRLAVAYGLDRATITDKILHGSVKPIYDVLPPKFLGHYSGSDSPHYNLAKAQAELNQCAYKKMPLVITYVTGSSDSDNTFAAVASMMRKVGFDAKLKPIPVNSLFGIASQPLTKSGTELLESAWQQDYPDPQDYTQLMLECGEGYNAAGYCNKTYDNLVNRANVEGNPKKRAQLYVKAQRLAIKQGAFITFYITQEQMLIKPYVHGLTTTIAYGQEVAKNVDWSKVTVSPH